MRTDIRANTLPAGGHLMLLILSVAALGVLCTVNFSIRWVQWCNVSAAPFADAAVNIGLVLVSAFFSALALSDMFRPQNLWKVPVVYGAFFLSIPTLIFFSDYLISNMLIIFSLYNVMRMQDNPGVEKAHIFFASFFVILAGWFVPAATVFLLAVYMGVLLFSPSDIRNWLIPLAGVAASYILLLTYEVVFVGGNSFLPEFSRSLFAMPYTEKVFKADGFYFYAVCLLLALLYAYIKYWKFAGGETVPRKKRFLAISAICVCAILIVVILPAYKYLAIFFALPFAAVVARFFSFEDGRASRSLMRWYLIILAGLGLLFFK